MILTKAHNADTKESRKRISKMSLLKLVISVHSSYLLTTQIGVASAFSTTRSSPLTGPSGLQQQNPQGNRFPTGLQLLSEGNEETKGSELKATIEEDLESALDGILGEVLQEAGDDVEEDVEEVSSDGVGILSPNSRHSLHTVLLKTKQKNSNQRMSLRNLTLKTSPPQTQHGSKLE